MEYLKNDQDQEPEAWEAIALEINAELVEKVFMHRHVDEYIIWLVLKAMGKWKWQNSGRVDLQHAINIFTYLFQDDYSDIDRAKKNIAHKIENGRGIFWNGDDKCLYLFKKERVAIFFDVKRFSSKTFILPINFVGHGWYFLKATLFSTIACRDERPVSIINLACRCKISESTARRYLRMVENKGLIRITENFCEIGRFGPTEWGVTGITERDPSVRLITNDGMDNILVKQLPNTFSWSLYWRGSVGRIRKSYRKLRTIMSGETPNV